MCLPAFTLVCQQRLGILNTGAENAKYLKSHSLSEFITYNYRYYSYFCPKFLFFFEINNHVRHNKVNAGS